MIDLTKIGDQNVEFFKGLLTFFCATKSAQPFKSYGRLKIDKRKKNRKNMANLIISPSNHVLVAVSNKVGYTANK